MSITWPSGAQSNWNEVVEELSFGEFRTIQQIRKLGTRVSLLSET